MTPAYVIRGMKYGSAHSKGAPARGSEEVEVSLNQAAETKYSKIIFCFITTQEASASRCRTVDVLKKLKEEAKKDDH